MSTTSLTKTVKTATPEVGDKILSRQRHAGRSEYDSWGDYVQYHPAYYTYTVERSVPLPLGSIVKSTTRNARWVKVPMGKDSAFWFSLTVGTSDMPDDGLIQALIANDTAAIEYQATGA